MKMTKLTFGSKVCHVTKLPYQAFRWKAGSHGRYKETMISLPVAQEKNICQACLNDLQYGVSVAVRDTIISQLSGSNNNSNNNNTGYLTNDSSAQHDEAHQLLQQFSHHKYGHHQNNNNYNNNYRPTQQSRNNNNNNNNNNKIAFRNLPKLCTFWLNGRCTRCVDRSCPFRPCNGIFLFPELASKYPVEHQRLIDYLQHPNTNTSDNNNNNQEGYGPALFMKSSLYAEYRQLFSEVRYYII
jgi:pre-mRNA-splicing factor RBM22/SLT11